VSLSPLDGRYKAIVAPLAKIFDEPGLVQRRVQVEVEYLLLLSALPQVGLPPLSSEQQRKLRDVYARFDTDAFADIQQEEEKTRHDVKSVENYLRQRLKQVGLDAYVPWVHFGLTSEDVNNLAQTLQLRDGGAVILAQARKLQEQLLELIEGGANAVMPGRTHGQLAAPTTMGKELLVFALQLQELFEELRDFGYRGKMTGAVGTLAAHQVALPDVDWLRESRRFVESFGLEPEPVTTQILPSTSWVRLFGLLFRLSLKVSSLAQDLWAYVSLGYFQQLVVENEVGSSTLPQKVNPIRLENAEGNAQFAAAQFSFFVEKFSHSRLQRDLSDSTVRRSFGTAYGHLYLSLVSLTKGLMRLELAEEVMRDDLGAHPEVLAEAVQVVLRREGREDAYEAAKLFFRGRRFDEADFAGWLEGQGLSGQVGRELASLSVFDYTGLAEALVADYLPALKERVSKLA